MSVAVGPSDGARFPIREIKGRFEDLSSASDVKAYLMNVLKFSGNTSKDSKTLSHYSNIASVLNIVKGGYLWLGPMSKMNDNLEYEVVRDLPYRLYFTSFSKMAENIAMYRMYSQAPNGVVLVLSYKDAEDIINSIPKDSSGKCILQIVRDAEVTNETVKADVYWAAVCYKELHSNKIKTGSVTNCKIKEPMLEDELAGFIKLDGWEFEKEVRLCAVTDNTVEENVSLAIKLPDAFASRMKIIKCPNFDKDIYNKEIRTLKKYGARIQESEYEDIITFDKPKITVKGDPNRTEHLEKIIEKAELALIGDSLDSYGECDSEIGKLYLSISDYLTEKGIKYQKDNGTKNNGHPCLAVRGLRLEYLPRVPFVNSDTPNPDVSALKVSVGIRDFNSSMQLLIDILRLYKGSETHCICLHLGTRYSYITPDEEAASIICNHDEFDIDSTQMSTYIFKENGLRFRVEKDDSRRRGAGYWGGIISVVFDNKTVKPDSIIKLINKLLEIGLIYERKN